MAIDECSELGKRRAQTVKTVVRGPLRKVLGGILPAVTAAACAYPSNFINDVAHMGNPAYDECRRNVDVLSYYGARCAREADPKVQAAKAEQARLAAEQQRRATEAVQQRQAAQRSADEAKGYASTSIRDFVLDGNALAGRSAKLSLIGVYMPAGNLELLFATNLDAIQFASGDGRADLAIYLMTESASREFRSHLLACRANPSTPYTGCSVRILGVATTCVLTNAFGRQQQTPCVAVHEGSVGTI